jgi:CDP-glucose 4,6-dehydratase
VEGVVSSFWYKRRVFLTGHTGFKGSWLSILLHRLGAEVKGYSLRPPTSPNLFELAGVARLMESVEGDVCNLEELHSALMESRSEILIHMAAQPLVRGGFADPVGTYKTNVMGTVNVLEAVRATHGLRAVVNVTTDKCYENRGTTSAFRESDELGGIDPYSSSKACAELVTRSFRDAYFNSHAYEKHGVSVATARAGNVIGGGDWGVDRLVPDIVRAVSAGKPVSIRKPGARRPWQHVLEPLSGYLRLAQRLYEDGPHYNGSWNFGPEIEDAQPVSWVADQATALWGDSARWEVDAAAHPYEADCLRLDCSKARSLLAWQPRLRIQQALGWTIGWYREVARGADPLELCIAQIEEYEGIEAT